MNISRELKVGIIAIIAFGALYWGISFLKGSNLFDNSRYYYAVYQRVDGLTPSRPININGFKIGSVDDISLMPGSEGKLVVRIKLTKEYDIPENTVARIYSTGLLGEKAIELVLGNSPTKATVGDTLRSDIELSLTEEVNRQVAPIKEKAEKLIGSIDTVMLLAQGFLNQNTQADFTATIESIKHSFAALQHATSVFDTTMTASSAGLVTTVNNLSKITTSLEQNRDNLDSIFHNLNNVSDSLAEVRFKETFANLNKAIASTNSVMEKINKGEGSVGKLIHDQEVYENLNNATEQLNLLLLDIKYNPNRYVNFSVFGSKKKYSEEEMLKEEAKRKKEREALQQADQDQ